MDREINRLDSVRQKLLGIVEPLDASLFVKRPAENEWSIAEIVDHLCLVEERVVHELERGLAGDPQKVGFLRRLIPISIVALRIVRVKAPKSVTPANPPEKGLAIQNLDASRNKLKQLCAKEGRARLKTVAFNHPFLGKMDGTAAVSMVGYHELRHYKQIRDILSRTRV